MLCFSSSLGFYRVYIHVLWSSWVKSLCETCQFEHILANPGGGLTELYKVCLTHVHATKWLAQELAEYFPRWSTVVQVFFFECVCVRASFLLRGTPIWSFCIMLLWFDCGLIRPCTCHVKQWMQQTTSRKECSMKPPTFFLREKAWPSRGLVIFGLGRRVKDRPAAPCFST